jgi:hypothetical protein
VKVEEELRNENAARGQIAKKVLILKSTITIANLLFRVTRIVTRKLIERESDKEFNSP